MEFGEGNSLHEFLPAHDEGACLLSKLDELQKNHDYWRVVAEQRGEALDTACIKDQEQKSRLGRVLEWLACSPMSERLSSARCDALRSIVGAVERPGDALRRVLNDPEAMERVADRASEEQRKVVERP